MGGLPFYADNIPSLFRLIKKGKYKKPGYVSRDAAELIAGMLEVDPTRRLSVAAVKNHRWLAGASQQVCQVPSAEKAKLPAPTQTRSINPTILTAKGKTMGKT